jgi:hypothetical protein
VARSPARAGLRATLDGPGDAALRRHRRQPGHAVQGPGEAHRVDEVAHPQPGGRGDRAGQHGPDQEAEVAGQLGQGHAARYPVGRHQPGQERPPRRAVDGQQHGLGRGQDVEQPELPQVQEGLHGEERRHHGHAAGGDQHQAAAVHGVGERAAEQAEQQDRDELGQPDRAHRGRGVGEVKGLQHHGETGHRPADG